MLYLQLLKILIIFLFIEFGGYTDDYTIEINLWCSTRLLDVDEGMIKV